MQWVINSPTLKMEAEGYSKALVHIHKSICVALHKAVLVVAVLSA
jgi:hypothetical protein